MRSVASLGCVAVLVVGLSGFAPNDPATSTGHTVLRPVSIAGVRGEVGDAEALVTGRGQTTLTARAGRPDPTVVLDFGRDVGGIPRIRVAGASGEPVLRTAYSESRRFLGPEGDAPKSTIFPRPGLDPLRHHEFRIKGPGDLQRPLVQGGERYVSLRLTTAGSVRLSSFGIETTYYDPGRAGAPGEFRSNDPLLDAIWRAGAYTVRIGMTRPGTPDGGDRPVIYDGAKRDRLVFSGDLLQQIPTITQVFGPAAYDYIRQSLRLLGSGKAAMPGFSGPRGDARFYSASYSMYFVLCLAEYYRESGDRAFLAEFWPSVHRELEWNASRTTPLGLLRTTAEDGADWDHYDGPKTGAVTAFNAIYHRALRDAAVLAAALGKYASAHEYSREAERLRAAVNARLFNAKTGVYDISDTIRGPIAQDANVAAIVYGIASPQRAQRILQVLRTRLWEACGPIPFSRDSGYRDLISPFISGLELQARFTIPGASDSGLRLLRTTWGPMVTPGPAYTGALWEHLTADCTVPGGSSSLAHGWSTAPTWVLSRYLLGVSPSAAGYRTWRLTPPRSGPSTIRGTVPTPHGPITVNWRRTAGVTTAAISVPPGTVAYLGTHRDHDAQAGIDRVLHAGQHTIVIYPDHLG